MTLTKRLANRTMPPKPAADARQEGAPLTIGAVNVLSDSPRVGAKRLKWRIEIVRLAVRVRVGRVALPGMEVFFRGRCE